MKNKYALLLLFFLLSIQLMAQNDYRWSVNGTLSVDYNQAHDVPVDATSISNFSIDISPSINYHFAKRWEVGCGAGFSYFNTKTTEDVSNITTHYAGGPLIRFYPLRTQLVAIFFEANTSAAFWESKIPFTDENGSPAFTIINTVGVDAGAAPGISLLLTKRWELEFGFGGFNYSYDSQKVQGEDIRFVTSNVGLTIGNTITTGVTFNF